WPQERALCAVEEAARRGRHQSVVSSAGKRPPQAATLRHSNCTLCLCLCRGRCLRWPPASAREGSGSVPLRRALVPSWARRQRAPAPQSPLRRAFAASPLRAALLPRSPQVWCSARQQRMLRERTTAVCSFPGPAPWEGTAPASGCCPRPCLCLSQRHPPATHQPAPDTHHRPAYTSSSALRSGSATRERLPTPAPSRMGSSARRARNAPLRRQPAPLRACAISTAR
ncbi:hypothetical protein BU26DRAFT_578269, partial [Trematosphaeria pertusa]